MGSKGAKVRIEALLATVLCIAALVLSFLCLFAGSSKGFMEDYAILTLNTSRIGENVVSEVEHKLCSISKQRRSPVGSVTHDVVARIDPADSAAKSMITEAPSLADTQIVGRGFFSSVESVVKSKAHSAASRVESAVGSVESEAAHLCDELADDVGNKLQDVLDRIGLQDWYSAHIMDFCEGSYIPAAVSNATVTAASIHKNVTACSNKTALYHFDPKTTIATEIYNATGGEIDLTDLHWPKDITNGLNALKDAQKAVFVFYCLAIAFIFLALLLSVAGVFSAGRLIGLGNVLVDGLAFLTILVASGIVTVIAVKATHLINKYGKDAGVSATRGNKFLALTWAATGLVFLATCVWCLDCCVRMRREKKGTKSAPKYG